MGIGPWAQGELIRYIKKAERARFKRALAREEKGLDALLERSRGKMTRTILAGVFGRLRLAASPRIHKSSSKREAS